MAAERNTTTEIYKLEESVTAELSRIFTEGALCNPFRVGPCGYLLWDKYEDKLDRFYNIKLRSKDIFVAGFPKSGTTWTQELVWLIANDFDFRTATSVPLRLRYLFLGYRSFINNTVKEKILQQSCEDDPSKHGLAKLIWAQSDSWDVYDKTPSPRFLKTHLPFSLLPPNILEETKVVFVARDPRDVAVSFYHHMRNSHVIDFQVEFKDFWNLFKQNLVPHTPYFAHFQEAWRLKDHPNMLFLFYEELSKDLSGVIRRVARFLGKEVVTDEQITALCEHLKIDNFRNNKMVNFELYRQIGLYKQDEHFIRKGKVGGWREYFDEEMAKEAEQWMEEGLRGIDFRFEN